jgi:hypothetical protein
MKRGAEAQLSKDHAEDEDNDVVSGLHSVMYSLNVLTTLQ